MVIARALRRAAVLARVACFWAWAAAGWASGYFTRAWRRARCLPLTSINIRAEEPFSTAAQQAARIVWGLVA